MSITQTFLVDFSVSMVLILLWLNNKTETLGEIPGYFMWDFQSGDDGCTSKQHKRATQSVAPMQMERAVKYRNMCCAACTHTSLH